VEGTCSTLACYKERHEGQLQVDRTYVDPLTGFELGRFVQSLKFEDDPPFSPAQRRDLVEVGIIDPAHVNQRPPRNWNHKKQESNNAKWEKQFQLLLAYRQEFPNSWPGTKKMYQGQRLGAWVKIQREEFKMTQGAITPTKGKTHVKRRRCLPPDRMAKLNAIGFAWNLKAPRRLVRDYQLEPVQYSLSPTMTLVEALEYMGQHQLSEAPVLEKGDNHQKEETNTNHDNDDTPHNFVGHVQWVDIIAQQARSAPPLQLSARAEEGGQRYLHAARRLQQHYDTVAHVMTPLASLTTCTLHTQLSKVASLLAEQGVTRLPVIEPKNGSSNATTTPTKLLGFVAAHHVVQDLRIVILNLPKEADVSLPEPVPAALKAGGEETADDDDEEEVVNGDILGLDEEDDEEDEEEVSSDEE